MDAGSFMVNTSEYCDLKPQKDPGRCCMWLLQVNLNRLQMHLMEQILFYIIGYTT